jgi:hypothetical protein
LIPAPEIKLNATQRELDDERFWTCGSSGTVEHPQGALQQVTPLVRPVR